MAICPDALPTDPEALTEMVLTFDAENEKLRVRCRRSRTIFGKRSERLATEAGRELGEQRRTGIDNDGEP